MGAVINGLYSACVDAQKEFDSTASLIMCFLPHLSETEAFETLEQALPFGDKMIGTGLSIRGHDFYDS